MYKYIKVYNKYSLSLDDVNTLNLFYLPLIGNNPIILYHFLNSLLNKQTLESELFEIIEITDLLSFKLKTFEDSRMHLEAIGLLETYVNNDTMFLFLKPPLTSNNFLKNTNLGSYLKSKIGNDLTNKLANIVRLPDIFIKDLKNISKQFDDVYTNFYLSDNHFEGHFRGKKPSIGIKKQNKLFDLDLFLNQINTDFINHNDLLDLKNKFNSTALAYGFTNEQMVNLYNASINNRGEFSLTRFKTEVTKIDNYIRKNIPEVLEEKDETNKAINAFETMTGLDLLVSLLGSEIEAHFHLNKLSQLYNELGYSHGIVNILVATIYKKNKEIPSVSYFKKVTTTWKEHGINNITDAYNYLMTSNYPLNNNYNKNKNYYNSKNKNDITLEDWQKVDVKG